MIFKDFRNIEIENEIGVSSPGYDTGIVAKCASNLKFSSALEVGTGTGFIPIYLAKLGLNCAGSDINQKAINCAQKNAKKNNCKINFYTSNLFEQIPVKFDLIIFNPPLGNSSSSLTNKYLEIVKSILPRHNMLVHRIAFRLFAKKQRIKLFTKFFQTCTEHLERYGRVLIFLDKSEFFLIDKRLSYEILDSYNDGNMRLAIINY